VVETVAIDHLAGALELGDHELISLVGGGGKTSALFALGRQLSGAVVLTTTTKMHRDLTDGNTVLFDPTDPDLNEWLVRTGRVLVWGSDAEDKARGVKPDACDRWFDMADFVVVEADGARQRPFTAPGPFEPVVPLRTTLLIACVGADAIGRVIADQCHRPLRVAALAECSPYHRLTPERLAKVLLNERGSRKGLPSGSRFAILVAGVDSASGWLVDDLADQIEGRAPVIAVARQ